MTFVFYQKCSFYVKATQNGLKFKVVHFRMAICVVSVKVGDHFDLLIALIDQAEHFLIVLI